MVHETPPWGRSFYSVIIYIHILPKYYTSYITHLKENTPNYAVSLSIMFAKITEGQWLFFSPSDSALFEIQSNDV